MTTKPEKIMFKKIALSMTAAALLFGSAAASAAELKIAVVNFLRLVQESPQAKVAIQALEGEFEPRRRQLEAGQKDLKAKQEKLQRDAAVMSEAERSKMDREQRDLERDLTRKQNEFVEDANVRRNEELSRVQRTVLQEVQAYAKANSYDLVIGDGVLFASESIDITNAVLRNLQARGAAPATAPAAGTAPKPANR